MQHPNYTNGPTYYPQDSFSGYVVYIDFGHLLVGPGIPTAEQAYRVFQIVAGCLMPAGLTVTNCYPRKLRPGEYTRLTFDTGKDIGWRSATGNTPMKQLRNPSWWNPCNVYAGWNADTPDALDFTAYVAAHEAAHSVTSLDLSHEEDSVDGGPNLMSATQFYRGKLSAKFVADIRASVLRFKAGERMCPFVPPQGGQWSMGWNNIGK